MKSDTGRYILVGKIPMPCEDLMTWARWMENHENRIVKQEEVGGFFVSTVFLGIDHAFTSIRGGAPMLFETMVFRDDPDPVRDIARDARRSSTWELALEEHEKAVRWAQTHLK